MLGTVWTDGGADRVPVWGHRSVSGSGKGARQVTWACTGVSGHPATLLLPRRQTLTTFLRSKKCQKVTFSEWWSR